MQLQEAGALRSISSYLQALLSAHAFPASMAESDAAVSKSGHGRTAVVSGGGPVGAVTAILLAEQGWSVQVLHLCKRCCRVLHSYSWHFEKLH